MRGEHREHGCRNIVVEINDGASARKHAAADVT
jgi:hypothetical protein